VFLVVDLPIGDKTANHIQRPGFNGLPNCLGLPGETIAGKCEKKVTRF
jgi:hypothetical protein